MSLRFASHCIALGAALALSACLGAAPPTDASSERAEPALDATLDATLDGALDAGLSTCVDFDGRTIREGERFRADHCNDCVCEARGQLSCVARACDDAAGGDAALDDAPAVDTGLFFGDGGMMGGGGFVGCIAPPGAAIQPGETWTSEDRCTTCTCRAGGSFECTTSSSCYPTRGPGSRALWTLSACVAPNGTPLELGRNYTSPGDCLSCACSTLGLGCSPTASCGPQPMARTCMIEPGLRIPFNSTWTAPDRCNTCSCLPDGWLRCVPRAGCLGDSTYPHCTKVGRFVRAGSTVLSNNRCLRYECPAAGAMALESRSGDVLCDDRPAGRHCAAPDGRELDVGMLWSTEDTCTLCECAPNLRLDCVRHERCGGPPAPRCFDTDGTEHPIGVCFGDRCRSCCCTLTGLSCVAIDAVGCSDAGTDR
jgi:hypothetical protein